VLLLVKMLVMAGSFAGLVGGRVPGHACRKHCKARANLDKTTNPLILLTMH
jgi:hypothetical protein